MIDELKQWEYDRGYEKGKTDVLDKIRTEIEEIARDYDKYADNRRKYGLWIALDIIDKYKAESDGEVGESE